MNRKPAGVPVFLAIVLLLLSGCVTQKMIGDPNEPLMPPGYGLMATTVVFQNRTGNPSLVLGNQTTLFNFEYVPSDGRDKERLYVTKSRSALWNSKLARVTNEDGPAMLLLTPAKPGVYRLGDVSVSPYPFNRHFWPKGRSPEIKVTEGQVTYVGSMRLGYDAYWVIGTVTPRYYILTTEDDFTRDLDELKAVEPRLQSVVVANALAR